MQMATPTQDLLSHIQSVVDENGEHLMSEELVAEAIMGLLLAGYDGVTSTVTLIIKYLAELPHIYDAVYRKQLEIAKSKAPRELLNWKDIQKMKYSWNVACEVMRLLPPSPGVFREFTNDFFYAGFTIPKGWKLHWSAHSTQWNPQYFPDPEKFDPTRFEGTRPVPYTHVPLGGGPSLCPGREYARLVILVFMHNVVKRFRWEKLLPDEQTPLPYPSKRASYSFDFSCVFYSILEQPSLIKRIPLRDIDAYVGIEEGADG
ncbi:hypothetical protein Cgig2_024415 [Carnegiea gigantea]|uniref:Cytochrome P450 n=1 Tax=Carnegiea gigantea TaxID=171969 RepID=A0A9Q1KLW3_9CARY|nr:hypothetical protein Cgig2_024415 [Carnegiea gigantea]